MSDTAATLAHQLALVNEAQLEDSAEELNALRLQLAAAELKIQQLTGEGLRASRAREAHTRQPHILPSRKRTRYSLRG